MWCGICGLGYGDDHPDLGESTYCPRCDAEGIATYDYVGNPTIEWYKKEDE